MNKNWIKKTILSIPLSASFALPSAQGDPALLWPDVPAGYFDEAEAIPAFWLTTVDEVNTFLDNHVHKGTVQTIGTSAGGRPIRSVSYGTARSEEGATTTFSGSLGTRSEEIGAYRGEDSDKTVFVGLGGVHGFELETIMGALNLISVLETGADLNGQEWPTLQVMQDKIDRIVIVPLVNPDGRARVPVRMERYRGTAPDSGTVHEYLNTGGHKDGSLIGWPDVKKYIPMDFSQFGFPGGYPNDAGVNLMHDDFLGSPQPETRALLELTGREKPDLILNMHTGVWKKNYFMHVHRPVTEPNLQPVFEAFYRQIKTRLTTDGLQGSSDVVLESDPDRVRAYGFNLNTALGMHSGTLCIVIESPSHGYGGSNLAGEDAEHTAEDLLKMQMIAYEEALDFLYQTGGRPQWVQKSSAR